MVDGTWTRARFRLSRLSPVPIKERQLQRVVTLGAAAMLFAAGLLAQTPAPAAPAPPTPLPVGTRAPDFALPGATRFGVLSQPVHLSDFSGKTVVLAFFYEARTKG